MMPTFTNIHHVAVTVRDLDTSVAFYEKVFGFEPATEIDDTTLHRKLFALPGGTALGLTQHDGGDGSDGFTPFSPGLDHLGLTVESREELEAWDAHLTENGVEHSGIVEAPYGYALSFKDPDQIALEFFVSK
ncbi:catechol 2,3-dioxygenase-like lactoylglutathione lyase family enzyme [Pseudoclavibacter sp. JAI123]|uniref:VOC family protein n=1 Tax=Pseudoclavibacter sp. JAI123 TaxID=2723065 RepID=UPI0017F73A09|nr:VOC family protein [Pseudoclavibacter sp. JAI123]NYF14327.1 catechol 2,3-dioxygenase-like lactoylglutathione lyase family enzyme [Pseudoclavibacter sp. JAI123]